MTAARALLVLLALAAPAAACPSCALGQGENTLMYVLAFMAIPYVVVSGVLLAMRRVLREDS